MRPTYFRPYQPLLRRETLETGEGPPQKSLAKSSLFWTQNATIGPCTIIITLPQNATIGPCTINITLPQIYQHITHHDIQTYPSHPMKVHRLWRCGTSWCCLATRSTLPCNLEDARRSGLAPNYPSWVDNRPMTQQLMLCNLRPW